MNLLKAVLLTTGLWFIDLSAYRVYKLGMDETGKKAVLYSWCATTVHLKNGPPQLSNVDINSLPEASATRVEIAFKAGDWEAVLDEILPKIKKGKS